MAERLILLAFASLSAAIALPMTPPRREAIVGLGTFCPGTAALILRAHRANMSLPKFCVAALNRKQVLTAIAVASAFKIRHGGKKSILARHTLTKETAVLLTQAQLCTAPTTAVLFMTNEFCQSLS
jgi:hypothetical protein